MFSNHSIKKQNNEEKKIPPWNMIASLVVFILFFVLSDANNGLCAQQVSATHLWTFENGFRLTDVIGGVTGVARNGESEFVSGRCVLFVFQYLY